MVIGVMGIGTKIIVIILTKDKAYDLRFMSYESGERVWCGWNFTSEVLRCITIFARRGNLIHGAKRLKVSLLEVKMK